MITDRLMNQWITLLLQLEANLNDFIYCFVVQPDNMSFFFFNSLRIFSIKYELRPQLAILSINN